MSEKVKLPKEICDALDYLRKNYSDTDVLFFHLKQNLQSEQYLSLSKTKSEIIMRALVLGYEPELSVEESTMQLWSKSNGYVKDGIRDALRIHGIRYDWMGAE